MINQHGIAEPPGIKSRNESPQKGKGTIFKKPYKTLLKRLIFEMPQGTNRNLKTKQKWKCNDNRMETNDNKCKMNDRQCAYPMNDKQNPHLPPRPPLHPRGGMWVVSIGNMHLGHPTKPTTPDTRLSGLASAGDSDRAGDRSGPYEGFCSVLLNGNMECMNDINE